MIRSAGARPMPGHSQISIGTVYDSVIALPGHREMVNRVIHEEFGRSGIAPTIRSK